MKNHIPLHKEITLICCANSSIYKDGLAGIEKAYYAGKFDASHKGYGKTFEEVLRNFVRVEGSVLNHDLCSGTSLGELDGYAQILAVMELYLSGLERSRLIGLKGSRRPRRSSDLEYRLSGDIKLVQCILDVIPADHRLFPYFYGKLRGLTGASGASSGQVGGNLASIYELGYAAGVREALAHRRLTSTE